MAFKSKKWVKPGTVLPDNIKSHLAHPTYQPSNDELKDAIKQFKAENPNSSFRVVLDFVRLAKAWFVPVSRMSQAMRELRDLRNAKKRDNQSYLEGRMASLLDSGSGDVRFIVGPLREVIRAHHIIVHHNCPSLLEIFLLKEDNTADVPDMSPEAFKVLIRFLYTARVQQTTAATVTQELLRFADQAGHERLFGMCVDLIASQLDVNNLCDIFCLCSAFQGPAMQDHTARLREHCGGFFHSRQQEVKWLCVRACAPPALA
jgi:hypothetical protein